MAMMVRGRRAPPLRTSSIAAQLWLLQEGEGELAIADSDSAGSSGGRGLGRAARARQGDKQAGSGRDAAAATDVCPQTTHYTESAVRAVSPVQVWFCHHRVLLNSSVEQKGNRLLHRTKLPVATAAACDEWIELLDYE